MDTESVHGDFMDSYLVAAKTFKEALVLIDSEIGGGLTNASISSVFPEFLNYNSVDEINKYKKGIFNVDEPNLLNIYKKFYNNIKFTNNISEINNTDIIFIAKDIKTNLKGNSDLTDLRYLINLVTKQAKKIKF